MFDLITIGGISVDLFFKGAALTHDKERFKLAVGGKYMADMFQEALGGSGANVAFGAKKNGLNVAVMGKIGNNAFKKLIVQKLIESEINYRLCDFDDDFNNISTILLSDTGERSIIHYMSSHQKIIEDDHDLVGITKTSMVFMGNLPDTSVGEREGLLRFFHEKKITTILNLGVKDCRRPINQCQRLLTHADIIILNGHEFSELVKAPYNDIHFNDDIVKWYIPALSKKLVIITDGNKGSYAYREGEMLHQKAIHVPKIVDSTGAGDGFTAAFIAEYHKTHNVASSLEKGALYAAKILQKIGGN